MRTYDITEVRELKKKVEEAADAYMNALNGELAHKCSFLYPWILVYVFPRRQTQGRIVLPDHVSAQKRAMKVTLEGIVLQTWTNPDKGTSQRTVGEHVLFPHYAGQPFDENYTNDNEFRLVKEYATQSTTRIGDDMIFGILENRINIREEISQAIDPAFNADNLSQESKREVIDRLTERFLVYPRNAEAVTLSAFGADPMHVK